VIPDLLEDKFVAFADGTFVLVLNAHSLLVFPVVAERAHNSASVQSVLSKYRGVADLHLGHDFTGRDIGAVQVKSLDFPPRFRPGDFRRRI